MTDKVSALLKKLSITIVVFVQIVSPISVFAEEAAPADVSSTGGETQSQPAEATSEPAPAPAPPAPVVQPEATPGPQQPNGVDSNTYVFNTQTGLWENDHYTWDPVTKQTKPKVAPDYSYNPTTNQWDTTEWYYSPEAGKYVPNTVSSATNPTTSLVGPSSSSISDTGPSSNNTITNGGNTTGTFDLFFNAAVSNKIGQMSKSGNASVQGNTTGGNALTGDATALANVLNMIQSTWGSLGSEDLAVFMANIDGDVVGDLYVDPSALVGSGNTDLDVTIASDSAIHNDIDVDVASGNALVNNNTKAGNATSGNAKAVVNLLNLINSAITSNKSFIGVLNINGNLNGDILLPPEMMKAIITATGPNSNNQINGAGNTTLGLTTTDNKTVNNDIAATASTGNAAVTNNTSAGNATTGKADTNVVLLNLTGQRVVAKNALLVFVNVMGKWVGLIFDAPAGTNAIAATGPGSSNTITGGGNLTVEADVTTESLIDNNIDVAATSGNAEVSGNTTAGNAKSGDASVGVNVLNMIDSEFEISDWFGVLFINVFGSWVGSFGVNTEAGNQPAVTGAVIPAVAGASKESTSSIAQKTFGFVPKTTYDSTLQNTPEAAPAASASDSHSGVVAAATSGPSDSSGSVGGATGSGSSLWLAAVVTLLGMILLAGERLMTQFRSRQLA